MTSAIFGRCSSILWMAREKAEDLNVNEILGNACIITTLLPLVLAHVGPLGASVYFSCHTRIYKFVCAVHIFLLFF